MTSFVYFEDDEDSRRVMDLVLTRIMNCPEVLIFPDSEEFKFRLDLLSHPPDLLLLDIHMKPYTGFEVLQTLRQDARYDRTRIVAITARIMSEEVAQLRHAGFDGLIGKPLNCLTFPTLIEQIVAGQSIWRSA